MPPRWREMRLQTARRARMTCEHCGQRTPLKNGRADHKVPHHRGGSDSLDNLQWLCVACHNRKSAAEVRTLRSKSTARHPGLL
ncbi:HNH endonuclease [Nocardia cyriacigeorgica]|uniref:HNH endonuclease n=1 Tax=Nocardia cyriacigeorgica TaxID=135487 RepID=UPI0024584A74|nr:HNH endonuclease signature motif containing protein [Nocardia cyriacigeorgica]